MTAATSPVAESETAQAPPVDWVRLCLGFGGMVIGQFMAILDIQIVAASLPQIQAGIGASADAISWVQTAYIIPEVVMIPLSGFLSRMWGTQRLFLASCAGFMIMSVATGLSSNLETMIITRALQGFLGGAMIPTVFATAFTAFPPSRRITASVIMGLIVTLAPTVGPTIGGHLSEALSWRWLFFINLFPGALVLFLVWRYADFDKGNSSLAQRFDWLGLGLMATTLMGMQFVLEEGSKDGWFTDPLILGLSILALTCGVLFVRRSLSIATPIVELRALGDRNFATGVTMTFVVGAALFGGTFLLPLFLGRVREFSPSEVGTTMIVSGLAMFLSGPIAGRIARAVDLRLPMAAGFLLCAGSMWMGTQVTSDWGFWQFASLQAMRGSGIMLGMIATQQVTMSTLPPHMVKNASGIVNLSRNVGGAFGLAMLNTVLTHQTAAHLEGISAAMPASDPQGNAMLQGLLAHFQALGVADPHTSALSALFGILQREAATRAFADSFGLLAVGCLFAACIALVSKPVRTPQLPSSEGAH
ncbi:MAG: DHA2 family efflux MFS transporter permease subunit [Caulobacterales bacterium]